MGFHENISLTVSIIKMASFLTNYERNVPREKKSRYLGIYMFNSQRDGNYSEGEDYYLIPAILK